MITGNAPFLTLVKKVYIIDLIVRNRTIWTIQTPSPSCPSTKARTRQAAQAYPGICAAPRKTEGTDPGEIPEPAPCGTTLFQAFKFWDAVHPSRHTFCLNDPGFGTSQTTSPKTQSRPSSLRQPTLPRLTPSRWRPWCPRSCRRRRRGRCPRCPRRIRKRTGWGWGCRRRRARGTACRRSGRRATCSARGRCG